MILPALIVLVVGVVYYLVRLKYHYWKKLGVIGPKPKFLVGNLGGCFLLKTSPGELYTNIYK
jgi:hypothetical protein